MAATVRPWRHADKPRGWRLDGLDKLRGLAVVLMVLDHALIAFHADGPGGDIVRLTLTRASLPLFCVVAGSLVRGRPTGRRLVTIAFAGCAATWLGAPIGIGQPDILLVLAAVLVVAPYAGRGRAWPWALAILQPVTWPIPWTGYQPGTVLALVLLGQLIGRAGIDAWGRPWPSWLAWPGRYPLVAYLGHLAALEVILWAF